MWRKIALPQTIDGLHNRLIDLLHFKDKNVLSEKECDEICNDINACNSDSENSSEDESDDSESKKNLSSEDKSENDSESEKLTDSEDDDINIYQLIEQTVQKVTKNTRENLTKLMSEVDETLVIKSKLF